MDSHAEVRASHRRNGFGRSAHVDLGSSLAPEKVQQQFAGQTAQSSRRPAGANRHPFVGPRPLDLEPARAEPPTQVATAAPDISPQGSVHRRREAAGPLAVRAANILVMNEELVETREGPDPSEAEEPRGRPGPDTRDEPRELTGLGQS